MTLLQFALSPVESSLTFSSLHGCALVAAVVVGLLCHRGAPPALFTITGLVSMMTGLFFIGPADFTDLLLSVISKLTSCINYFQSAKS